LVIGAAKVQEAAWPAAAVAELLYKAKMELGLLLLVVEVEVALAEHRLLHKILPEAKEEVQFFIFQLYLLAV
jgi:hypothetical protein